MTSHPEIDWTKPQRQSPSALVILLYKAVIDVLKFIWPLLLLMIVRHKSSAVNTYELIALGVSILSLGGSAIEYFTFRFSLVDNELIIRKGFFTRKNIVLPLEKIQAVHAEQPWLHALFKVSRLSFDSPGAEKMEVKIEALDRHRAAGLQAIILGAKTPDNEGETEAVKEETLVSLSGNDLARLSLSANHIEAFLILLVFIFTTGHSIGVTDQEYSGAMKWLVSMVQLDTFRLALFLALTVLIISVGISVLRIIFTYSNFLVTRSRKGYRITSGLLNKKEKFVPFRRIQFVSWKANWIRQKINLFLFQFHSTSAGADDRQNKMQIRIPVTRRSFIPVLLENYHPLLPVHEINPVRIHRAYIFRRTLIYGMLPCILLVPALYYFFGINALFAGLLVFWVWTGSWLFQRKFRLWPAGEALQIKKGFFGSYELLLKWNKIQSVHLEQSIYQRSHRLATLELKTADGNISVPYITLDEARQIQDYCLYKIESAHEAWA